MERYYVNDLLPALLMRDSAALPRWLRDAYADGVIVPNTVVTGRDGAGKDLTTTDGLAIGGGVVRSGGWIVSTTDGVFGEVA